MAAALALAVPAAAWGAPATPFSFLRDYTDQLGVPGFQGGTGVTAQSDLYTGYAELSLRAGPSGRAFPSNGRTLEQGRYPILTSTLVDRGLVYTLTTFAAPVGDQQVNFVRVEVLNPEDRRRQARVTAFARNAGAALVTHPNGRTYRSYRFGRPAAPERPGLYFQPGTPFDPLSQWAFSGRVLLRDGAVVYDFPARPPGGRVTPALRVDLAPVTAQTIFGQTAYDIGLAPHQRVRLDFRMPVTPVPPLSPQYGRIAAASFDAYRRRTAATWARTLRGAFALQLPEGKVVDTFYASLMQILLPRYRLDGGAWVQAVNLQRYHAFWLRDGAGMTHALDVAGLRGQAAQDLPFFLTWQGPDGLFISRPGQLDGFGQALWAISDHVLRDGDGALVAQAYPAIQRAMAWFEGARAADPLRIMPASNPGDNEYVAGHLAGDDFWAYAGIERAIALARRMGRGGDASRWSADLADFRTALQARVRAAAAATGGYIPPALDVPGGQDWGNYWAAYPAQALPASDPAVSATIAHARGEFREGIATYGDPKVLHAYLGFRVLETQLERGEQADVVRGLYDELAHTTSTNASFETAGRPFSDRVVDLATVPHGLWAAEYVTLLRNMLVREDGDGLVLMSALSPAWLRPGQVVAVRGAPTEFGTVSFRLTGIDGGARLTWETRLRGRHALSWPIPAGVRNVRAPGRAGSVIRLRGRSGALTVSWRLNGPRPTFAATVKALLRAYGRGGAARAAGRNAAPTVSDAGVADR